MNPVGDKYRRRAAPTERAGDVTGVAKPACAKVYDLRINNIGVEIEYGATISGDLQRRLRCGGDIPEGRRAIVVIKQSDSAIVNTDGNISSKAMPRKIVALTGLPKEALNI